MKLNCFTSAVWDGFKTKTKKGEDIRPVGFFSRCIEPLFTDALHFLMFRFCVIVFFIYVLTWFSYICIALLFKLQSALRLFWIFLNMFLFIWIFVALLLFLCVFLSADLPSMARCILTSMRDLYSVTLHFSLFTYVRGRPRPCYPPELHFNWDCLTLQLAEQKYSHWFVLRRVTLYSGAAECWLFINVIEKLKTPYYIFKTMKWNHTEDDHLVFGVGHMINPLITP